MRQLFLSCSVQLSEYFSNTFAFVNVFVQVPRFLAINSAQLPNRSYDRAIQLRPLSPLCSFIPNAWPFFSRSWLVGTFSQFLHLESLMTHVKRPLRSESWRSNFLSCLCDILCSGHCRRICSLPMLMVGQVGLVTCRECP